MLLNAAHHSRLAQTALVRPTRPRALHVAGVDFAVVDGEGGCLSVCALPLVSKSENAKEVLCALHWPLSASKSVNAAKVRPSHNCPITEYACLSHPCSVSTLCNSEVRSVQVPCPPASTGLAARCPHMHRLEVPRPVRVRRGCRCPRMHRLQVHRPFRVRRACRCQQMHRLKVHRPFRVRRACRCPRRLKVHRPRRVRRACKCLQMHRLKVHRPYRVKRACRCPHMHRFKMHRPLQVPAKAQAQGAQALPGQACSQVPAHVQAQGAQALPGQTCLQVPVRHRLQVHRPFRLRRARRCPHTHQRCTGPGQACPWAPANVADATGPQFFVAAHTTVGFVLVSFVRRPRLSRCRRSGLWDQFL